MTGRFFLTTLFVALFVGKMAVGSPQLGATDSTGFDGFVIALAWPNALAKEANDGYDKLMRGLGFNDGGYYRVGHAALILVNDRDSTCHFFDFGRYHAPPGKGRVRDEITDVDLTIATLAQISGKHIANFNDILCEINSNPASHASGSLYASYVRIHFHLAYAAAKEMQDRGAIPYGPFEKKGSNCSRFVRKIILAGDPNWAHALRLKVVPMITPTTLYPMASLYHWTKVAGCLNEEAERRKLEMMALPDSLFRGALPAPDPSEQLPENSQWLAGESAGSWFHLQVHGSGYQLTRYSRHGQQECASILYTANGQTFNPDQSYTIDYISHCKQAVVLQAGKRIVLN